MQTCQTTPNQLGIKIGPSNRFWGLVSFIATREAVALVANDPIISGTFIWLFRQIENQTPSSNS